MQGVSSSRKFKVRQRKRLSVLVTRYEQPGDLPASAEAPWLALARHTRHKAPANRFFSAIDVACVELFEALTHRRLTWLFPIAGRTVARPAPPVCLRESA